MTIAINYSQQKNHRLIYSLLVPQKKKKNQRQWNHDGSRQKFTSNCTFEKMIMFLAILREFQKSIDFHLLFIRAENEEGKQENCKYQNLCTVCEHHVYAYTYIFINKYTLNRGEKNT